jgi:hypothetical protein
MTKKEKKESYVDGSILRMSLSRDKALVAAELLKAKPRDPVLWDDLFLALSGLESTFVQQAKGCTSPRQQENAVACFRGITSAFESQLKEITEVLSTP